ncbi:MAG: uroporphyrinogen-III C-methyltransferase [Gammaproteobacteria bacterium]|nr:uroporphyrinogen-III C-methyltransferase [Gammaproteobacteria bacterium]
MDTLPIFLRLRDRACLVVGAGPVAAGKADVLVKAGARVLVVAPEIGERVARAAQAGGVEVRQERFAATHLYGQALVIAATDDAALNAHIVELAAARGILANAASDANAGSFIMPAIIDRSPVVAAVSTGGASPVLARFVRARLETLIPRSFGELAILAREFRGAVKERLPTVSARRAFWDRIFSGPVAELVFSGRRAQARAALAHALEHLGGTTGEVYLVGAGPGDPDLLSFRAMRLMQQADVVVYDRLVSAEVLDLVRRDAEKIYAGKKRSQHTLVQEEINALLVRLAKEGRKVLRLKGGDPFVFGRGGEEIATLADENIPFQVVPGVTAASGCAAYAGIPLTHRDHAHACLFVTGNTRNGAIELDWPALIRPMQTVVIYMGLTGLTTICAKLIEHGMDGATPAALVQQGTLREQRVITATVATLPRAVQGGGVRTPSLVIIGGVVTLHESLKWFAPEAVGEAHRTLAARDI